MNQNSTLPRLMREGTAPKTGIVHLGPGAFFRAFNAVFTDDAMRSAGGDWGITAVSLRSPTARDQLVPQGGVYTSVTLAEAGRVPRVITALNDVLVAPDNPGAVLDIMTDPNVRIVSLTITEKGYCHAPATGHLMLDHPDIAHDLGHSDTPRSALGFLVFALARRRAKGIAPFTVLSCDNLPSNGQLTRQVVLDFARAHDAELAKWIGANVTFPATMVDRITPATTEDDVAQLGAQSGYDDPGCVVHEAFRQWVIEDDFVSGRPAWDVVGAQLVQDVSAHELMKLRCLNGTHSTLAYLGYLSGFETISETIANPHFAQLCRTLWRDEILPTVPAPQGEDLQVYCDTLLARYRDAAIKHRTWQIAMDGSQKLPQRILGTIRDGLALGYVPTGLCLAVAGWMRYVGGVDEAGQPIDVRDPLADQLRDRSQHFSDPAEKVSALLSLDAVFGDLGRDAVFGAAVTDAYENLAAYGAKSTVEKFVS